MLATERLPELLADLVAALETALATLSFRLAAHLARITAALESPSTGASATTVAPVEARTETISSNEEAAQLHQRLRDAADEARALGTDLAAAQAWEAARLQEKQR